MARIPAPVTVAVRTDWLNGTPRELTWEGKQVAIRRVLAVRDERNDYPAITGPRTIFEVETDDARFVLSYQHRSKCWTVFSHHPSAPRRAA